MEFQREPGRIFSLDASGRLIAEVTFPAVDGVAHIDHTFVDDALRGQGVAGALLAAAAQQIRSEGYRAKPVCTYAVKWFSEHPEAAELL